jgi:serine/threonine protein kinase
MACATTTTATSALHNDMIVMEEDDMDLIDIHNLIGSGSSAQVYLGKHTKLNLSMAVKLMKKDSTTERGRKRINRARNEGLTMAALQHKNICKVFGTLETKKYVVLLLEFCKGGALSLHLHPLHFPFLRLYFFFCSLLHDSVSLTTSLLHLLQATSSISSTTLARCPRTRRAATSCSSSTW